MDCRFVKMNNVILVTWNKNSVVILAANVNKTEPIGTAKSERKIVDVEELEMYHYKMGVIDRINIIHKRIVT